MFMQQYRYVKCSLSPGVLYDVYKDVFYHYVHMLYNLAHHTVSLNKRSMKLRVGTGIVSTIFKFGCTQ